MCEASRGGEDRDKESPSPACPSPGRPSLAHAEVLGAERRCSWLGNWERHKNSCAITDGF